MARAFLLSFVLVFVFWGWCQFGQRTQVVAEVNGESIYYTDVQKIMRRMQRNESLNEDEVLQLRSDAIEELIKQTALQTYTKDMGIEVSDTEISLQLLEIDAFKGPDGKFDADYTIKSSLEKPILKIFLKSSNEREFDTKTIKSFGGFCDCYRFRSRGTLSENNHFN